MVGSFVDYMDENGQNSNAINMMSYPEFFLEAIELTSFDNKTFIHPLEEDDNSIKSC